MERSIVRAKAFTVRSNNGWTERFKGVVTLLTVTDHNKEHIETYQCDQARLDRDLAQADADRLTPPAPSMTWLMSLRVGDTF